MSSRVLVTGGGGFLGAKICEFLLKEGYDVISFSRKDYPLLKKLGAQCIQGDLTNPKDIEKASVGCQAIIHSAALAGVWGKYEDYYQTNVIGTENVLKACIKNQIKHLVYTSSPSVVFAGKDICGDDTLSYPTKFLCHYSETKSIAEKKVLQANDKEGLYTLALRPHLIWGADDPHFLPRLREKAKKNKLFIIGTGKNQVDAVYVDNAAFGHVKALQALEKGKYEITGQSYFLGQERPVFLWEFLNDLLIANGLNPIEKKIPYPIAYLAGFCLEKAFGLLFIKSEPPITRFMAQILSHSHYFSHQKAEKAFDYRPIVSIEEGLERMKMN